MPGKQRSVNARYFNWLIHQRYVADIEKHASYLKGRLLDVGCGKKPYYHIIAPHCEQYIGVEYANTLHTFAQVDVIGDSLCLPFRDESFDSVVSFQVMEHVRQPFVFMAELYRVLKPDGYALLTTPFMWGEHEAPYDFFRYTRYGLAHLAQEAGFEVVSITPHTRYCETAVLRFNYWIRRYGLGPLEYVLMPFLWANQHIAVGVDNVDTFLARLAGRDAHTTDTAGFTTMLYKPR